MSADSGRLGKQISKKDQCIVNCHDRKYELVVLYLLHYHGRCWLVTIRYQVPGSKKKKTHWIMSEGAYWIYMAIWFFSFQITVETQKHAHAYETVSLTPGYDIKPDMFVDINEKHLFVMSTKKVGCSFFKGFSSAHNYHQESNNRRNRWPCCWKRR